MTPKHSVRWFRSRLVSLGLAGSLALVGFSALAADAKAPAGYLLTVDALTGAPLGASPVTVVHEGRELRFANQANADKFKADPASVLKSVDQKLIALQTPTYPLDTCLSTGEKLGSMGKPADIIHGNRLVRFCCEGCVDDFKKNPEAALKKIDAAVIEKQAKAYPVKTCVVSDEQLGSMGKPIDVVLGTQLVRLCCDGCADTLAKNPGVYLQKLSAPAKQVKP